MMFLAVSKGEIMLYTYHPGDLHLNRGTEFTSLYRNLCLFVPVGVFLFAFFTFSSVLTKRSKFLIKYGIRLLVNTILFMFPVFPTERGSCNL